MNDNFSFSEFLNATKSVRYAATAALALLALFLLMLILGQLQTFGRGGQSYPNTITVEGTGEATAIPDIAEITFTVQESASTVDVAQTAATDKTNAALAYLEGQGIEERDVKTLSYNVYPRYESFPPCYSGYCPEYNRAPSIIGYEVSQSVSVKVRDTGKAGTILQGLGSLEVQNISGPNFVVDEADAVRNAAREEAIAEAKEKAKALADQLGVRLGKVVSFYENPGYGYPMYDRGYGMGGDMAVSEAAAPSLPVGESETAISVSVTYEIR